MKKIVKKLIFWGLIVLLVFASIKLATPINPAKRDDGMEILGHGTLFPTQNILLLGLDSPQRSDTIMLIHLDGDTKTISLLSIPRDTKTSDGRKINSSYGENGKEEAVMREVQKLTGLRINYYITVKPNAFKKIIDYLGGVDYNVPMNMKYTSRDGKYRIDLNKGQQHLTGDQAEQLVRFRKGYITQDIGRIGTQQDFIKELLKQKLTAENIFNIHKIITECKKYIRTNYSYGKAIWTLYTYRKADFDKDIKSYTVPGEPSRRGVSYWEVDYSKLKDIMQEITGGK